jgi:hypothetical protein
MKVRPDGTGLARFSPDLQIEQRVVDRNAFTERTAGRADRQRSWRNRRRDLDVNQRLVRKLRAQRRVVRHVREERDRGLIGLRVAEGEGRRRQPPRNLERRKSFFVSHGAPVYLAGGWLSRLILCESEAR